MLIYLRLFEIMIRHNSDNVVKFYIILPNILIFFKIDIDV